MNILILGNYPPPYGGVPHHIKLLSNFLGEKGNNVIVVAGGNGKINKFGNVQVHKNNIFKKFILLLKACLTPLFGNILRVNGLNFSNIKYFLRLNIFYSYSNYLCKKNSIDIILSYNLYYYSPIAFELHKKFQIPYIVNVFGEIYRLGELRKNDEYYLEILGSSKYNISCSNHCAKSIEILNNSGNISYKSILYGIDLNIFRITKEFKHRNKIGFFGRVDTEMGIDIFQEIITKMSNSKVSYIVAGQKGNYFNEIESFKNNSKFNLETYYNIKTENLADLYNECCVVIVPTRGLRTCSSLATMEAMACGCIVLGHNLGGIPELINNNNTGFLIDFERVDLFVDKLNLLLNDELILNQIRERSIDFATNNFSDISMCNNFYALLNE